MVNLVAADPDAVAPVEHFPYAVRVVEHADVPLGDRTTLSARLWLPEGAGPAPAVVEYAPFRHRDFTAPRDALIHPWFAGHGYAAVRLELRGSGDSTGVPMDEYVVREQDDALEALEWIAAQPWCDGGTALIGMSWGGFSALQVAARRPPSLATVLAVHATDDRFGCDVHYMGGCQLYNNLSWGALLFAYMARPPDPEVSGPAWRERWLERIDHAPFVLEDWAAHQRRDAYWRHGSVGESIDDITCPVYVACGWADGYTDAAMRLARDLGTPRRVIVGPWAHTYPHLACPAPRIDFLQDATRWLDRWTRGEENRIEHEDPIWLYVQDAAPPAPAYGERAGYWTSFEEWPPVPEMVATRYLAGAALASEPGAPERLRIRSPRSTGASGGEWLPHGVGPEMPLDLRLEDRGLLWFETEPLDRAITLCGAPRLALRLACDAPSGQLAVHLVDVHPDGASAQISYAVRNLALDDDLAAPRPLVPGRLFDLDLALGAIAQTVPAGHRLRLGIASACWPLVWPSHHASTIEIDTRAAKLTLPLLGGRAAVAPPFGAAVVPATSAVTVLDPVTRLRSLVRDPVTGRARRRYVRDDGAYRVDGHGMVVRSRHEQDYWVTDDPDRATEPLAGGTVRARIEHRRGDWRIRLECDVTQEMTRTGWTLSADLRAFEGGALVRSRHETRDIDCDPRPR